jgi:hypothetical protein
MERRSWTLSAITLVVLTLFLFQGVSLVMLPSLPKWHDQLLSLFQENSNFYFLGGIHLAFTALLGVVFFFVTKERYLALEMNSKNLHVELSPPLVQYYIDQFWKEHYPEEKVYSKVAFEGKGDLSIKAEVSIEEEELEDLEVHLTTFLNQKLSYKKSVKVYLHCQ